LGKRILGERLAHQRATASSPWSAGVPGDPGCLAGVFGDGGRFADISRDGGRFADVSGDGGRFADVSRDSGRFADVSRDDRRFADVASDRTALSARNEEQADGAGGVADELGWILV